MFYFYFILSLCVVASCNRDDEWFNCKPKPGCSIARCDPRPAGQWFGNDGLDNDYPILCQQNEAPSSTSVATELVKNFDEIRIDLSKIEGRLERSDKVEFQMNFDITILEKKTAETEIEMDRVKKEVQEGKTKLNSATKQITSLEQTNDEMRNEINSMKKEEEEDKRKLNGAIRQINLLKKRIAKVEKDAEESKGKTEDLIKRQVQPTSSNPSTTESSRRVPTDWIQASNNLFYMYFGEEVNYETAKSKCARFGARLIAAGMRTEALRREIKRFFPQLDAYTWIGLDDLVRQGSYVWSDGVESTTENTDWKRGQPNDRNDRCGYIRYNVKVGDTLCSNLIQYLCELAP